MQSVGRKGLFFVRASWLAPWPGACESLAVDFAQTLATLGTFLSEQKIRFALAGGLALHAHGLSRPTGDVDLLIDEAGRDAVQQFVGSLGYQRLHASDGFSNHLHADAARGRLDFIYVDAHTADLIFTGAVGTDLFPGVRLLVPRPEHLAAMKVLAMKNDPSRTFQDLADIQFLLGVPGVDSEEIRRQFERHGLSEKFDELERARARK